jgi:hypothetical protein
MSLITTPFGFHSTAREIIDGMDLTGRRRGFDWDVEAMGQVGDIGGKSIRAWAVGSRSGYTIANVAWAPRLGLQIDAASGDHKAGDKTLGTFNPLFTNGYCFTLAGNTGYVTEAVRRAS